MRDEDDRGAGAGDLAHVLHEGVPRRQVEAGGRLVEHQRPRLRRQHPRQHHPPRLAARHLIERPAGQVRRADLVQRLVGPVAHLVGDHAVAQDAVRGEEGRDHRRFAGDPALAVAAHELLVQRRRHHAELGAQVRDVPAALAEHPHRLVAVVARQRPLVVGEQADQHRLAGAVGPDDGGVLARADGQPQAVQHRLAALHHRGIVQHQYRRVMHGRILAHSPAAAGRTPHRPAALARGREATG